MPGAVGPPRAAMLFAAGFGTRMGALAADRPKPLIPVAGRTLLDHALEVARGAGVARIVVNAHYRAAMIRAHLARQPDVTVAEEPGPILDTGGGLRAALPLLGPGPVFTLNTDAVWTGPNPLRTLAAAWDPAAMDALLLLAPPDRATGHGGPGDFVREAGGRLSRAAGRAGPVFLGAAIVHPRAIPADAGTVFSLNRAWDAAAARGRLHGAIHPGGWCDVGHPAGIALAEALLEGAR